MEMKFYSPKSLSEALGLLDIHQCETTKIMAGGTDLMPRVNARNIKIDNIIYIGDIGLDYIEVQGDKVKIGAATKLIDIVESKVIAEKLPVLKQAVDIIGSMAIRNAGTIGGNIANASPAADCIPPLMVMDAEVILKSKDSERKIKIAELFIGPGKTIMEANELLTEIVVTLKAGKCIFIKLGRRKAETLSVINTAVRIVMNGDVCQEARIVIGAAAPTPLNCKGVEQLLVNQRITDDILAKVNEAVAGEISPISDQRATAWYRQRVAQALVKRAILAASQKQ